MLTNYDPREVGALVRDALALKQQIEAGYSPDDEPVEAEIARRAITLLRVLRDCSLEMIDINKAWVTNGITAQIGAAALAGETLAGYAPATWAQWGAVLPEVMTFLATTYVAQMPDGTTRTESPEQTLQRRYLKEVQA
jgi:hypothetical protein